MSTSEPQAASEEAGASSQRIEAFRLLADIVAQSASGRQLTASQARIQMKRRSYGGFSPEALGYTKFRDFLLQADKEGYVQVDASRPGDYALSAPDQLRTEVDHVAPIRSDLWKAVLDWSPSLQRVYDIERDQAIILPRKPAPLEPAMFRETRERLRDESGNFIAIEPIVMRTQLEWRREFIASVADSRVRALLETALASEKPAKVFSAILREVPEEQARWHAIQRAQVRAFVERWRDGSPTAGSIRIDPLPRTQEPSSADDESPSHPPAHLHARSDQLSDLLSIVNALAPWTRSQGSTYSLLSAASPERRGRREPGSDEAETLRKLLHSAIDRMPAAELKALRIPVGYLFEG